MSGPIVRKYGFPNFEKIFGERPMKHGEESEPTETPEGDQSAAAAPKPKKKAAAPKPKKKG